MKQGLQTKPETQANPGTVARPHSVMLQRRAVNQSSLPAAPQIVHEALRSPGQRLDPAVRSFMEPRFGHDFSRVQLRTNGSPMASTGLKINPARDRFEQEADQVAENVTRLPERDARQPAMRHDFSQVRVHTGAKAAKSARAVNALAYTVGRDVVFGAGQYEPETRAGRELLAHELAHVVQQGQSSVVQRRESVSLATEGVCVNGRAIAEAIPGAKTMAETALNWFLSFNDRDRARVNLLLRANFLSDDDTTHGIVKNRIVSIRDRLQAAQSGRIAFVCAPAADPECGDREGYVLDSEPNKIHICNPFFGLTLEGRRWMLIHECAHLAGAKKLPELYWGFFGPVGESQCRQVTSHTSTNDALGNADNYTRLIWCLTRQAGIEITPP
jgi:hypothetical protein